ncbi:MAG: aldo/keto reductase [Treponema sp.]|nr:aldo/keto reductase [Treponema sp.]
MIYRNYGQTGKKVSLLGFGGMRFAHVDDHDECVRMVIKAAEGGINYFDTAPGYFETKSETVYGLAFKELDRLKLPYYTATKTFKTKEDDIRREVEGQLTRLKKDSIDFYHIWCVTTLDNWTARKKDGILDAFRKLKEEGLIKHICVSSHLIGGEIETLLMEGVFEGVLFGYSAYNYRTREKAFNAIRQKHLGAVVMNPLGGGIIPQNPALFKFIMREGESAVSAGLRFLWDHQDISVTLVGFGGEDEVAAALEAMNGYVPRSGAELEAVKSRGAGFEGICTGCTYCDDCPQGIPIPRYMDSYNQKLLKQNGDVELQQRLTMHWSINAAGAGECVECGACEAACTQHIPIIERLKYIAAMR